MGVGLVIGWDGWHDPVCEVRNIGDGWDGWDGWDGQDALMASDGRNNVGGRPNGPNFITRVSGEILVGRVSHQCRPMMSLKSKKSTLRTSSVVYKRAPCGSTSVGVQLRFARRPGLEQSEVKELRKTCARNYLGLHGCRG